jgi:ribonucleotide reductase alpha subunit
MESIGFGLMEDLVLGSGGGGIGRMKNLRGIGRPISNVGTSSGKIPFYKVDDAMVNAVSQGALRRASKAEYLHISDIEIEEFIKIPFYKVDDAMVKAFSI